ncbi:MAG: hypothetical protein U1E35_01960 [Rhodospirillales bacterium]
MDGDYWFFSRRSEVIRQQTLVFAAGGVEAALYRHPAVREVGVAGVPDGEDGQRVVAHIVRQEGAAVDEQTLLDFVSADLGADKLRGRSSSPTACPTG